MCIRDRLSIPFCYIWQVQKNWIGVPYNENKLLEYLKANRVYRPMRKVCIYLKHLLKAKKVNGTVKDIFGKDKSCPTWRFKENPNNFIISLAP